MRGHTETVVLQTTSEELDQSAARRRMMRCGPSHKFWGVGRNHANARPGMIRMHVRGTEICRDRSLKRCGCGCGCGGWWFGRVKCENLGLGGTGGGNALLGELALVEAHSQVRRGSLGDLGGGLGEEDLGVDGVALVRVDAAVSTVRAAARLGSLLDDNVADDELLGVKALGLGVGLGVLEQSKEELDRLDGPSTCEGVGCTDSERSQRSILCRMANMAVALEVRGTSFFPSVLSF